MTFSNCSDANTAGTTCTKCNDTYYLDGSSTCTLISSIVDYCATGNISSGYFTCTYCIDNYYLDSDGLC